MERSELSRDSQCSVQPESNSNCENDGNTKTTLEKLNDDQNHVTIKDSRCDTVRHHENDKTVGENGKVQADKRKPRTVARLSTTSVELPPAKLFKTGSQPAATKPPTSNAEYYICTTCIPNRRILAKNTKIHRINVHLDEYFLSSKQDSEFQNEFEEYCNYLIKQLVRSAHRLYDRDVNPILGCEFCCYTCKREEYMQYHLCSTHEYMVKEELVRLQQDTTSITELRAKANRLEDSCFSYSYCFRCLNCQAKFRTSRSLEKHMKQAQVCRKKSGAGTSRSKKDISHPRVPSNHPVTCENCDPPKQFKKYDMLKHKVLHHVETLLIFFKPQDLSKEEFKRKCESVMANELNSCERKPNVGKTAEFVCSHCSYILKGKENLRYHIYSKHKNALMEKVSK